LLKLTEQSAISQRLIELLALDIYVTCQLVPPPESTESCGDIHTSKLQQVGSVGNRNTCNCGNGISYYRWLASLLGLCV